MKGKNRVFLVGMSCLALFIFDAFHSGILRKSQAAKISVVAHTSGTILRSDSIRVRFSEAVVDWEQVGKGIQGSPISLQPAVKGKASWSDRRTLKFQPEKPLPPGRHYVATVKLSFIEKTAPSPDTYQFAFNTMKQSFELTLEGLEPIQVKKPEIQQYTGRIITETKENNSDVEKMLTARQNGVALKIDWVHGEGNRDHTFRIRGIRRGTRPAHLMIQWDGAPIGIQRTGERLISIPAVDVFGVVFARAVQDPEEFVEIRFTDNLDEAQDLQGLISAGPGKDLRFDMKRNSLRVYSPTRWKGTVKVRISPGVRSAYGHRIEETQEEVVHFEPVKPRVRFPGKGVIVPTTRGLTVPIEAVNLRAVIVEAEQIFTDNIPQFLQVNALNGTTHLHRVGRRVWKKTVRFGWSPEKKDRWVRYGLDMTPLLEAHRGGLFRLTLSFKRRHVVYACGTSPSLPHTEEALGPEDQDEASQDSYWDSWEQYQNTNWQDNYRNRKNPCHPGYYRNFHDHRVSVSRNIMISDIGLIAKKGTNHEVLVFATDIRTAQPAQGVELRLLDYQQQTLGEGATDAQGASLIRAERTPFLLVARRGEQYGYLRLNGGSANAISHFDVAGEAVKKGIKGFIYGERGVWRPGDPIYLTFILMDPEDRLPENHPVRFELRNPRGQLVKTVVRKTSLNGFYSFHTKTDPDAPTGTWQARVRVGGVTFNKTLKIETVMPNRLKIKLDFGEQARGLKKGEVNGTLTARWLHGAKAKKLKADVKLRLTGSKTAFPGYEAYNFDDPVRVFKPDKSDVFKGVLDENGRVSFTSKLDAGQGQPGMLNATFITRVFEPGGAFSIDRFRLPFHPYERYVGVQLPKGDKARGMLLTDQDHRAHIVLVDSAGRPVPSGKVEVEICKIKWRWWWEKGEENLAGYVGTSSYRPLVREQVEIADGRGEWTFQIKYPSWGRYLIRVRDLEGDHMTGQIVYMDWPGWAGRGQKEMPGGASILSFSADKEKYRVGDRVKLTIPTGKRGRGLVSIESGSKVLHTAWIEGGADPVRYAFSATADMVPNVYAHVTFLQPHLQAGNDLPIRMYGIIPVAIYDPGTGLDPRIETPEVFAPEARAAINVSERDGKPMTYTLAIVDEGLLDLTRFRTPDPWHHFYRREALGVKTWDLFDEVAGAYGAMLEQLLAIGGGQEETGAGEKKARRFPPMVRFLGPFELEAHGKNTHQVDIPQYVGSVRVMVVAGGRRAYGAAEKSVFVRKPLMVLGTLPRVFGPEERVDLPVSVFALEDQVRDVMVEVHTEGPLSVVGPARKPLKFQEIGDKPVSFILQAGSKVGAAGVNILATAPGAEAGHGIEINIRMPVGPVLDLVKATLPAQETWEKEIRFPGMPGTNRATLEISRIPPLNLERRLTFLIRYPYGCVEQVVSSLFPQLYLDRLMALSPDKADEVQHNIREGIDRLRAFQTPEGGFAYWPGQPAAGDWVSSYAGHFLVEAEKLGYVVPSDLLGPWRHAQRKRARSWIAGTEKSQIMQAYRLYTLALADGAELGAMNRLRESYNLSKAAGWRLAAAYTLAGQPEASEALIRDLDTAIAPYRELSLTYGSDLRDKAMVLEALCLMDRTEQAQPLAEEISDALAGEEWLSTQTTAYALMALTRLAGMTAGPGETTFAYVWDGGEEERVSSSSPIIQKALPVPGDRSTGVLKIRNPLNQALYARIMLEGFPALGGEKAGASGLAIVVSYQSPDGAYMDPSKLEQGADFVAQIMVENTGRSGRYEALALHHIIPSGWEIHHERMDALGESKSPDYDYQDVRDDRIYTFFDLPQGISKIFKVLLNAAYRGRFYLPMVSVEAMYDATIHARTQGQWCEVTGPDEAEEKNPAAPSGAAGPSTP